MAFEGEEMNKNKVMKGEKGKCQILAIDRKMWRFKLHYFLFIGGIAAVFPYVPYYANKNIGISTTSLAVILMLQQFLIIVTKPLIGYLADYFNQLKAIICFLTVIHAVCIGLILIIPKIEHSPLAASSCLQHLEDDLASGGSLPSEVTQSILEHKANNNSFCSVQNPALDCKLAEVCCDCACHCIHDCCFVLNETENVDRDYIESRLKAYCLCSEQSLEDGSGENEILSYKFWIFVLVYTLGMVSNNAVFTLSDTACCESVEKAGAEFGRQRLWGAIGWGTLAPLGGFLNDYSGSYIASWMLMEICLCLVVWNIMKLELQKPHFSKNIMKDVGSVLKSGEFLIFEAGLLMNGIGAAIVWYYLIIFLLSIGASKLLCGLSLTVQSFVGTLPLMYFSGTIIKKFGHLNVCSLALMMYTARFLWYSYLYNPWLVLFVEWLHGLTYGLLYANIASFGKESSKPGTEATTQSLLFSTHEGLGGGIGCVLGGLGIDLFGGHQTFFIAGLFTACGFLLHQLGIHLVQRRKGNVKITPQESMPAAIADHKV